MRILTTAELSAVVRHARKRAGLTQAQLAERIGVGRLWVVRFEQGTAEVELGIALRALRALGLALDISTPADSAVAASPSEVAATPPLIDLDALLRGDHRS